MKRVAITGATGAIGLALIEKCIEHGTEAYVFVRRDSKRIARIPEHPLVHKIYCSLDEMAGLDTQDIPKIDVFYHFAWMKAFGEEARDDLKAQIKNIEYAIDSVELAKRIGCRRYIGAGSQAEYGRIYADRIRDAERSAEGEAGASVKADVGVDTGAGDMADTGTDTGVGAMTDACDMVLRINTRCDPENGYGMAKLAAGQMTRLACEKSGMEHIWTRVLSVYGPGDGEGTLVMSVIRDALSGSDPECTKAEQIWDYLYSKDVGEAFRLLGEKGAPGKTYVLGSGKARPLREYIEDICDACHEIAENAGAVTPIYGAKPYGAKQVMHLEADISEIQKDTGFSPQTDFKTGIRETIRWFRREVTG